MNKTKLSLIACSALFAFSNTLKEGELHEIKILKVGEWKGHEYGYFKLELQDLEQIKTNFDNMKVEIMADIEHESLYNIKTAAVGWILELEIKKEELWAKVKWLDEGKELIESEKFKYISPTITPNTTHPEKGEDIGWTLNSISLTNKPFFEDLGEVLKNSKNSKTEDISLEEENEDLKKQIKELKEVIIALEEKNVETEIDSAIANNKVSKDQKDSLLTFGKADRVGLSAFLSSAKPSKGVPPNNIFPNNKQLKKDANALSKEEMEA